jgi:membrane protein implicated in regulation of membrane protease activity
MKMLIIAISLVTAIAFLLIAVISTWQIFTALIAGGENLRGELWILLIVSFTGGVIMLAMAWGIAELTESRRVQREILLSQGGQASSAHSESV